MNASGFTSWHADLSSQGSSHQLSDMCPANLLKSPGFKDGIWKCTSLVRLDENADRAWGTALMKDGGTQSRKSEVQ